MKPPNKEGWWWLQLPGAKWTPVYVFVASNGAVSTTVNGVSRLVKGVPGEWGPYIPRPDESYAHDPNEIPFG